ncbi:MAG: hypothetical protein AUG09_04990 [Acidobacteria bacterium 13_1_20CM_2_68_7]|nr:MAG: hypothetical protein AUG09_04990 [Acidobacteria bacterium 13_1_20CM_2_68_7]
MVRCAWSCTLCRAALTSESYGDPESSKTPTTDQRSEPALRTPPTVMVGKRSRARVETIASAVPV